MLSSAPGMGLQCSPVVVRFFSAQGVGSLEGHRRNATGDRWAESAGQGVAGIDPNKLLETHLDRLAMHRVCDHPLSAGKKRANSKLLACARVAFGASKRPLCFPPLRRIVRVLPLHYITCVKAL